ncbi:molybdate transport system substrate-binding protein [Anaerobacterium chartisolvens]|uniref:Molybdate transport system substrate-binding protein n=1 Tax=Anaerobacterium chartisolvens TaxID=1297424 RepID=A0A369BKT0_9FIRM|nr:molybdate ABC transporter substrate-binding protein [Anaerobacterium chartisolvens]RCX21077.1 molybdate transport system substrate-binding protein [Anaerobacterium chartisolvens]
MRNLRKIILITIVCAALLVSFECTKPGSSSQLAGGAASSGVKTAAAVQDQVQQVSITISAAASLKDAMEKIKQLYSQEKSNVEITYNFGPAGSLQQQIEQGAPVDVFMSAAVKQMNALKEKELMIDETIKDLLRNKVVLVEEKGAGLVKDFNGIANDKVKKIALGEPKSVPVGQYAEEIISFLEIKDKVEPKSVYAKDVKEVLTWVETGNADVGVVYETDAKVSEKVSIAAYAPENSHRPVVYPVGVVKATKNADAAKEFLEFLSGDKAKAVFEKFGFTA